MIIEVDRVSRLSVADFQEKYFSRRPVVITDVMGDWGAIDWTVEQFRDQFSEAKMPVRMDDDEFNSFCTATNDLLLFDAKEVRRLAIKRSSFWIIRLDAYFDAVLRGGSMIDRFPYIMDVPLLPSILASHLRVLGIDTSEDWNPLVSALDALMADVAFPEYLAGNRDYRFWFTPRSRNRGVIHADEYHNLNAQIRGRKEWTLSGSPVTEADIAGDQGQKVPRFTCATKAGEMLYIPKSWWHAASAVGTCININAWHVPQA